MKFVDLLYDVQGPVAIIRFNRPRAFNAMTVELLGEIAEAFDRIASDPTIRVVVVTGAGRAFSSGADLAATLAALPRGAGGEPDLGFLLERYYNPLIQRMRSLDQVVIAAVNGIAAGGASSFALAADLTVAARSATFLQAFVNVALVPDVGGSWTLPRTIGRQRAMGLALLGQSITAHQALELGLIWAVSDDDVLMADVMQLAQRIAQGPRLAMAAIKQALNAAADNSLAQQLALEERLQRACGESPDFVEAARAFVEKRKPNFAP